MMDFLRRRLRSNASYLRFRELTREGLRNAWLRHRVTRRILETPPILTASPGTTPYEVRVMTYRRDWISQIWALKSFYHFAGVDWPLTIHDGGLTAPQVESLRAHFPAAAFVSRAEAATTVGEQLMARGLPCCAEFSRENVFGIKLIDYYVLSRAERVIHIDADVLFFKHPGELLAANPPHRNLFNRDQGYWYTRPPEELAALTGVMPLPAVNAGLGSIWCASIDLGFIEDCLARGTVAGQGWLVEQTLHALLAARFGGAILPNDYFLGPGGPPLTELVTKHYPGSIRALLYQEGMTHLIQTGF
ncbi:MAG: hypothetical protein ACRCZF_18895, partial [Gemmataceae bacterium]